MHLPLARPHHSILYVDKGPCQAIVPVPSSRNPLAVRLNGLEAPYHDGLVAPHRTTLQHNRCDTPYRAIPSQGGLHSPKMVRSPPFRHFLSYKHICAIDAPCCSTSCGNRVTPHKKQNAKEICDTIATSIARDEKHHCWASKHAGGNYSIHNLFGGALGPPNIGVCEVICYKLVLPNKQQKIT